MSGPLAGIRVVEFAGIGPVPFAATMLADMGAEVVRVDRPPTAARPDSAATNVLDRGRQSISLDLKHPAAVAVALDLIAAADALVEGFRPGVMERLGLGPPECAERNPGLVWPGWWRPAGRSGQGQVVDAAIVEGAAMLTASIHARRAQGSWLDARGTNKNDTGSHFYNVYRTADDQYITLGALEPGFYTEMLRLTGLADDPDFAGQWSPRPRRASRAPSPRSRGRPWRPGRTPTACWPPWAARPTRSPRCARAAPSINPRR